MTVAKMRFLESVPNQLREIAKELKKLNENIAALTDQVKENTSSAPDKVTTVCFNHKQVWNDRRKAINSFEEAMMNSEGAERERYFNVWVELKTGNTLCADE